MEFNELKELIELFAKNNVDEMKLQSEGLDLKLSKTKTPVVAAADAPIAATAPQPAPAAAAAADTAAANDDDGLIIVESPIVGTFYRSPNPNAEAFVQVGSTVTPGQTLCIVEAMKLMNEIQAEQGGVVAKIFVENGEGVEFGQKLIGLKPA